MEISRTVFVIVIAAASGLAQMTGAGSLRDPRMSGGQSQGEPVIQPWLAVSGSYNTPIDTYPGEPDDIYRSAGVSGGLSMVRPFHRSTVVLGYSGSAYRYFGLNGNHNQRDWLYSNVVNLSVGTQLSRRLTLDIGEFAGATNGGYGYSSWAVAGLPGGILGSMGVASGSLNGGNGIPPGATTNNPLENNLVDSTSTYTMTYFSTTSASLGVLLSQRTMLSFGGSAYLARRPDYSFSDTNGYTGNVSMSTYWTKRFLTFANYSYTSYDYINSIGGSNINSFSVGTQYQLGQHDMLSGSLGASFVDSHFLSTILLPPDVAKLLGVPVLYYIADVNQHFITGSASYNHSFQRGGFGLSCGSGVTPGNDLLLLTRRESCGLYLNGTITRRMSVSALAGALREDGLAQAGTRYQTFNTGAVFSYRFWRGVSFTAGASYYKNYIKPSTSASSYVNANVGLHWSPEGGLKLF